MVNAAHKAPTPVAVAGSGGPRVPDRSGRVTGPRRRVALVVGAAVRSLMLGLRALVVASIVRLIGASARAVDRGQDERVLNPAATDRARADVEGLRALAETNRVETSPRPVPVVEVARAALSEIDGLRVDVLDMDVATVIEPAVADLVRLIAEFVESSPVFSAATALVTVVGRSVPEGYRLRIVNHDVGPTDDELRAANLRIADARQARSGLRMMGLDRVGRLAGRRGIGVRLEAPAEGGVAATVVLPVWLLADETVCEQRRDARGGSRVAGPDPDLVRARRTASPEGLRTVRCLPASGRRGPTIRSPGRVLGGAALRRCSRRSPDAP